MLSVRNLRDYPAGRPLSADDVLEFHAARLLLLLHVCGRDGEIEGLTKLAKLDFFARYPAFFARACAHLNRPVPAVTDTIEASMVRHHYGPWDHRYYHVLSYLEATGVVRVRKTGANAYRFTLTERGGETAARLAQREAFAPLRDHMRQVRAVLGTRSGDTLKKLIYTLFREEVAERPLGETIT
jgi:hypothetical protein